MRIAELFNVDGQVALVTGGASGIGYACAEVLVENGARVCIIDREAEKLGEAEARLSRRSREVMSQVADATDPVQVNRAVADVLERFGRLDIAFINAGIGGGPGFLDMAGKRHPNGAIENLDDKFWYGHIAGNLTSVFVSLKNVVPPMRKQGSGSIIVTTSVAALKAENFVCTPYLVAKAGAAHLVRQVALELAKDNIRVNAMAPGAFLTGIGGGRMAAPEVQSRFAAANPMGRMATPDEIKGLALYLASPASSYMTGAELAIDGGGSLGPAKLTRETVVKAEDLYRVADKVVVVTGGANGLGFAMARAMSDNGARVVIVDRDREGAARAVFELSARGGRVRCEIADLADGESLRPLFDGIAAGEGGLDVVFANAGITAGPGFVTSFGARDPNGAIENIPNDLWDAVLRVNLHGVFKTIQAAVPHLKKRGGGRIIVTTSTAATKTTPAVGTSYPATKAAIAHLVRQLALELARFDITVNAIQPGPFQTRITTPELAAVFAKGSPSHRIGRPEEIEGLALFFASDASSYVTGAQYTIDGGQLLGVAD